MVIMTENEFIKAVKRNNQRLYLIALSFTKNPDDSEDIIQVVFEKLWSCKKSFNNDEHIDKWLTAVCVNESKDLLKSFFKSRRADNDEYIDKGIFDDCRDYDLFNAVMKLPKKERVVIHLFYYEDLPVNKIAQILKTNDSTVKTRLRRGRLKLKEMLGDDWINE